VSKLCRLDADYVCASDVVTPAPLDLADEFQRPKSKRRSVVGRHYDRSSRTEQKGELLEYWAYVMRCYLEGREPIRTKVAEPCDKRAGVGRFLPQSRSNIEARLCGPVVAAGPVLGQFLCYVV
jgi:hypothetical protein